MHKSVCQYSDLLSKYMVACCYSNLTSWTGVTILSHCLTPLPHEAKALPEKSLEGVEDIPLGWRLWFQVLEASSLEGADWRERLETSRREPTKGHARTEKQLSSWCLVIPRQETRKPIPPQSTHILTHEIQVWMANTTREKVKCKAQTIMNMSDSLHWKDLQRSDQNDSKPLRFNCNYRKESNVQNYIHYHLNYIYIFKRCKTPESQKAICKHINSGCPGEFLFSTLKTLKIFFSHFRLSGGS